MGAHSRNKGAAFEREIAKMISEHLGITVKRDLEQVRESDHGDLTGLNGWSIECKRYASGNTAPHAWWEQACRAAYTAECLPVLIYKFDRRNIVCRVPFDAFDINNTHDWKYYVEMDFPTWCYLVREHMAKIEAATNGLVTARDFLGDD